MSLLFFPPAFQTAWTGSVPKGVSHQLLFTIGAPLVSYYARRCYLFLDSGFFYVQCWLTVTGTQTVPLVFFASLLNDKAESFRRFGSTIHKQKLLWDSQAIEITMGKCQQCISFRDIWQMSFLAMLRIESTVVLGHLCRAKPYPVETQIWALIWTWVEIFVGNQR